MERKERGITLVALIVTIVVLLILAGITIATLFGDNGVINKAKKAKEETNRTAVEEQEGLNKTKEDMANAIKGNEVKESGWKQPDPLKPEITNGEVTLKIGDYVDYSCKKSTATYTSIINNKVSAKANAYDYGWRVLGVDKNTKELQLISEDFVPITGGISMGNRTRQYYRLGGQSGYASGVEELNNICSIYGTGEGATGARSVNVDDIDWITGYNPNNTGVKDKNKTGNGTKCYARKVWEYGNNVKYTLLSTGVKYEIINRGISETNTSYTSFDYYDETSKTWRYLAKDASITFKSNAYYYYPTTLTETNNENATTGIAKDSTEYKMLFTNSSTGAESAHKGQNVYFSYWLASSCISTSSGRINLGMCFINTGYVSCYNFLQADMIYSNDCGIRPVVNLDSKVQLKDSGEMQDGCKLYNMMVNK